jgi:hypothetical protein
MKPEIKQAWVKALRSGEYTQGLQQLKTNTDRFCCLGVLCDLACKAGVVELRLGVDHLDVPRLFYGTPEEHSIPFKPNVEAGARYEVLPKSVMEWAGLDVNNPELNIQDDDEDWRNNGPYPVQMAELNDELGYSFNRLARLIESQL